MPLRVVVDGKPLPEDEARALWKRFSDHMEEHKGDLGGFAKAEGFASVQPAMGDEGAELRVSRSKTQAPYRNVSKGGSGEGAGGSGKVHAKGPSRPTGKGKSR
ncbi:hypothetical protein BH09MYX1_BH09MYX1_08190 [soil metagenome]